MKIKFDIRLAYTTGIETKHNIPLDSVDWYIDEEFLYDDYESETGESPFDDDWTEITNFEFNEWIYKECDELRCDLLYACKGDVYEFHGIEIECVDDTNDEN